MAGGTLTISVDHPQPMFRICAGFPGFEDGFRPPLVFALYVFQLFVRQVLQPHKCIVRFADANEFVQLHLDRGGVTVLRILDQEHHQKRDNGRAGVDHKLPSIREPEERTRNRPDNHGPESKGKHPGSTYFAGTDLRDFSEQLAEDPRVLGCPSAGGWWWGTVLSVWVLGTGSDPMAIRIPQ
jgi:hypothetical protein